MTRINTNVSSLTAQQNLQKSNTQLQTALTRLSTGLRINSGKDDPAGMISAAQLGSEINSTNAAISNSKTAEQIINTADSALSQVTSLLNDIRGLITQAANKGAMSPSQIAANQSQIDSSLDAINRIARTTNYQGLNLLDGSMGYQYTQGTHFADVTSLAISQATLGTAANMPVTVTVNHAAKQAELDTHFNTAGVAAKYDVTTASNVETITAPAVGTDYNGITYHFQEGSSVFAHYDTATKVMTIQVFDSSHHNLGAGDGITTAGEIETALGITEKYTGGVDQGTTLTFTGAHTNATFWNTTNDSPTTTAAVAATGHGSTISGDTLDVTAAASLGANGNVTIKMVTDAGGLALDLSTPGVVKIHAPDATTWADIVDYVSHNSNFTMTTTGPGGSYSNVNDTYLQATGFTLTGGQNARTAISTPTVNTSGTNTGFAEDVVFNLTGDKGTYLFQLNGGTDISQVVANINSQSDSTGIQASTSTSGGGTVTHLTFTSIDYGTLAPVTIDVVSGGTTFKANMIEKVDGHDTATMSVKGTDVDATVNGIVATGNGNALSISTPALALEMQLVASLADATSIDFTITGGGAMYQLGSNINTNNQANFGIQAVDTGHLGGSAGLLFQLASGNDADLSTSATTKKAADIIDQAVNQITSLRGRLGSFQKTTLETNITTLGDTVNALTNAQSTIQDADFASETANLTRAQILVQSGTAVLQIANRGPQQVLALLQNL